MTMVYGHFLGGPSSSGVWWQSTRLCAIRRSGSPASLTRASRLINLPQPSAQLGAAWPARHRWQYGRRQAASGSCSHPSLTSRPHRPQRPAWRTPMAQAPQQGPPAPPDALRLRPTPCGRRKRCRRRPASPTAHPEAPDRPRKSASHPQGSRPCGRVAGMPADLWGRRA
jgi:hypothetical protein